MDFPMEYFLFIEKWSLATVYKGFIQFMFM